MIRVVGYRTARERGAAGPEVASHLEAGGIVAYPTETVYGLGCTLRSGALATLAAFKGDRPFLLLVRDRNDTAGLEWTPDARRLADAFWPGPLTLVLPRRPGLGYELGEPADTVGVRCPDHALVRAVAAAVGVGQSSDGGNTWYWSTEGLHATYCRAVALAEGWLLASASTGPATTEGAVFRRPLGDPQAPFTRCGEDERHHGLPRAFPPNVYTFELAAAGPAVDRLHLAVDAPLLRLLSGVGVRAEEDVEAVAEPIDPGHGVTLRT